MARIESDVSWRVVAIGACAIIVGVLGWTTASGLKTDFEHDRRITALEASYQSTLNEINRRLSLIEQEIRGR